MEVITKPQDLVEQIKGFEHLGGIEENVLQWLVDNSVYKKYDEGESIFKHGQEVNEMRIKPGYGYWDITNNSIGEAFRRADRICGLPICDLERLPAKYKGCDMRARVQHISEHPARETWVAFNSAHAE